MRYLGVVIFCFFLFCPTRFSPPLPVGGGPNAFCASAQPRPGDAESSAPLPYGFVELKENRSAAGIEYRTLEKTVSETGTSTRFFMRLSSPPVVYARLSINSNTLDECVVRPSTVLYNRQNWDIDQAVTVTGVDDDQQDGDQSCEIMVKVDKGDERYGRLKTDYFYFTNRDDDQAGMIIQVESVETSESGGEAAVSVSLRSSPRHPVTIPVSSGNPSEGTVTPKMLEFSPQNWNQPQKLTITGQNDFIVDGDQNYTIQIGPVKSKDTHYDGLPRQQVELLNIEDSQELERYQPHPRKSIITEGSTRVALPQPESAQPMVMKSVSTDVQLNSIQVSPHKGKTSENGGSFRFWVRLVQKPKNTIIINLKSTLPDEGIPVPERLTITPADWKQKQFVTVTGKDDTVTDGSRTYQIILTPQSGFLSGVDKIDSAEVTVVNEDNDGAAFILGSYDDYVDESGKQIEIPLKLASRPTAPVTLTLAVSLPSEAKISPEQIRFDATDWDRDKTITVTGLQDYLKDGDKEFSVVIKKIETRDPHYSKLKKTLLTLVNRDMPASTEILTLADPVDLKPGVTEIPGSEPKRNTLPDAEREQINVKEIKKVPVSADYVVGPVTGTITESGGEARFSVHLNTPPEVDVTLHIQSDNPSEATVTPETLVFTPANWKSRQNVYIRGVDDQIDDGDRTFLLLIRSYSDGDFRFSRLPPKSMELVNVDNDTAGVLIKQQQKETSEEGKTASLRLRLTSKPLSTVEIPIVSDNPEEGIPQQGSTVFTPENWDIEQTVLVVGKDDHADDGDTGYHLIIGPPLGDDSRYTALGAQSMAFTNIDNDSARVRVSHTTLLTSEDGDFISLELSLQTKPYRDVILDLKSSDPGEGVLSRHRLLFTDRNWNQVQRVDIIGQDDFMKDGDAACSITISSRTSPDDGYAGLDDIELTVTNKDNDTAGLKLGDFAADTLESGTMTKIPIKLLSRPFADVTIHAILSDPKEARIDREEFRFTTDNWNQYQFVEVSGVDDQRVDGDVEHQLTLRSDSSGDTVYDMLDPVTVHLRNMDDDRAGFRIDCDGSKTSENEDPVTCDLVLTSEPADTVTIRLKSNDETEGIVKPSVLKVTAENWNNRQRFVVHGVNDQLIDGEKQYQIITEPAESSDAMYNGLNPRDIHLSNLDNNLTTFFVSKPRGNTGENGQAVSFNVRLNTPPRDNVRIRLSNSHPAEAKLSDEELIFTPVNWDLSRRVTVSGLDDRIDDGDREYTITLTASSNTEKVYNDIPPIRLKLKNVNDDVAGIRIRPMNSMSSEKGDIAKFAVRLTSQPLSSVVLLFKSSNTEEGVLLTEHAAFLVNNWNKERVISIKGVPDFRVDGNQEYTIHCDGAISSDPVYNKMPVEPVQLVNKDMDQARFIVGPISGDTTEIGGEAFFTVRLNSKPSAPVSVSLVSEKPSEGTVDKNALEFTAENWNIEQKITVRGVDDYVKDGDTPYRIVFRSALSNDSNYHGLTPPAVQLTNIDNKRLTAGLLLAALQPYDSLDDEFSSSVGISLNIGYTCSKDILLILGLTRFSLTGTPEKTLWGDRHIVRQELDLTILSVGSKFYLLKRPLPLYLFPEIGVVKWQYQAVTLTDGSEKIRGGSDLSLSPGIGVEFTVLKHIFLEIRLAHYLLGSGLGNRQASSLNLGAYYPF